MQATTLERVRRSLADILGCEESSIGEHSSIIDDLGADSLDCVEILIEMEAEFGLAIEDEDAELCHTPQDIARLVERLAAE